MEIVARSKYVRMSPRKLQLVAGKISGFEPKQALVFLSQMGKKGGSELRKTLKQAISNAKNNFALREEDLKIKKIRIDEGPIYKRWQPVLRGRVHPIKKRTSHITVILEKVPEEKLKGNSKSK